MTVIKLKSGDLWVHSPEQLNGELKNELLSQGNVKHLVSPNKMHHLFLAEWIDEFPEAITYAAPGLSRKRKDIKFDVELSATPDDRWSEEISQTIFRGSPAMEEVVFYHKPSSTLILTDLIQNFNPRDLSWWQWGLAKFAGILSPVGGTPIDWRISFLFGNRKKAQESLATMLEWNPKNIVLSHGECVFDHGVEFINTSFSWLRPNNLR
jgi:hypothetical protein